MDIINDAIAEKRKINFIYNDIGTDFKLHPRREEPYVVNPYQIVANNGRFYLICNYDKYDNVAHFRIDRMTDVHELEEKIKPMKEVPELDGRLNLPKHMAEHIYMFSGPSSAIKLATTADMMSELVDWFGTDFKIMEQDGDRIVVRLNCNEKAMRFWALQYGPYVEVLGPESLRKQVKTDIAAMSKKYKD
jgi:predicted DNA-binding transcriptional regulator YafY